MLSEDINKIQIFFNEFLEFGSWKDVESVKNFLSKEINYTVKN